MRLKLALSAAIVFAGQSAAVGQTVDPGAWYQEQVRRNQSNGTIGINPVIPPTVTTPQGFQHDEVYQRQQGNIPRPTPSPAAPRASTGVAVPTLPPVASAAAAPLPSSRRPVRPVHKKRRHQWHGAR